MRSDSFLQIIYKIKAAVPTASLLQALAIPHINRRLFLRKVQLRHILAVFRRILMEIAIL